MKFGYYKGKIYKEDPLNSNKLLSISNPLCGIKVRKLDADYDDYAAGSWLGRPFEYGNDTTRSERILAVHEDPLDLIWDGNSKNFIISLPVYYGWSIQDIPHWVVDNGSRTPELEEYRLYHKEGDNYYLVHEKRRK